MTALVTRLVDWFWLRAEERAARADAGGSAASYVFELAGRAAVTSEVATQAQRPPEPFVHSGSDAVVAELYRESIHWALLAYAARRDAVQTRTAAAADVASLLVEPATALLRSAASGEQEFEQLESDLSGSYRDYAELSAADQRALVERLERASRALLEPLGTARQRVARIRTRRALHVVGAVVLVAFAVLLAKHLMLVHARASDLSADASWTTSSTYGNSGCPSPRQLCGGGETYFFHTNQERDPWIIFDLGKVKTVTGVEVDNRIDCCTERAIPLAVDVSLDERTWHEVARRTRDFATWRATFDAVEARYVKLHVPQADSILHLSRVWIYP